jgi:hypothetical protein
MKHSRVLKRFRALSIDGKAVTAASTAAPGATVARLAADGGQRDAATTSDQFRAMLEERSAAPYAFASAYRHWGINEW